MPQILRSALFKRQLIDITSGYRERGGANVALNFVDQAENSIRFIASKPLACPVYTHLEDREFRKWRVKDFPVSIFFRLDNDGVIILEALYAHRMDIAARLPDDIERP